MTILGGMATLAAIWLTVAWAALFNSQFAGPPAPQIDTLRALHKGMVEVGWTNVAGADRYELQLKRPSGWLSLPDDESGIAAAYDGPSASVGALPADHDVDVFRVRAGNCRGWSGWSSAAKQSTTHEMDWDGIPLPTPSQSEQIEDLPRMLWSALISPETDSTELRGVGLSVIDGLGSVSNKTFLDGNWRLGVLSALQTSQGFVLELVGREPPLDDFWVSIETSDRERVAQLSSCDALMHKTSHGTRFVWADADVGWSEGRPVKLNISQGGETQEPRPERMFRLRHAFSAQFEEAPAQHSGDEFSLLLRFSEPVAISADQLRTSALRVTAGHVTSVEAVDGRADLWEIRIAPDGRTSVQVAVTADRGCAGVGAICTQHFVPLSNRPAAFVPGPPITAEFIGAPEYHSGLDRIALQIAFSEPIFARRDKFRDLALHSAAGSVERVRRVDGRSDLWEVLLIPESSDDLVLSLDPDSGCPGDPADCLNLRRVAGSPSLTIPPATVYLTFDDGPDLVNTPIILDILARHNARATFFVVGRSVVSFPEVVERMVSEGHTLANHTWAHDDLLRLTEEEVRQTLLRTQAALGEHATPCFRPPNYRFNERTVQQAAAIGLKMVLNTGGTEDWRRPGAEVIAENIVANSRPNAILVLHDGGGNRGQTIEALEIALRTLSSQRYVFEPVCE